eukprot:365788-Chlamydomonas_euryale.AAC.11
MCGARPCPGLRRWRRTRRAAASPRLLGRPRPTAPELPRAAAARCSWSTCGACPRRATARARSAAGHPALLRTVAPPQQRIHWLPSERARCFRWWLAAGTSGGVVVSGWWVVVVGGWWLVVGGGWWRLVAVGGEWWLAACMVAHRPDKRHVSAAALPQVQ